jgi:hypothetical protein
VRQHRWLNLLSIARAARSRPGSVAGVERHGAMESVRDHEFRRRLRWAVAGSLVLHVVVVTLLLKNARLFEDTRPASKPPILAYLASGPIALPSAASPASIPGAPPQQDVESDRIADTAPAAPPVEPTNPTPTPEPEPAATTAAREPATAPAQPAPVAEPALAGAALENAVLQAVSQADSDAPAAGIVAAAGAGQDAVRLLPLDPDLEQTLERRIRKFLEKNRAADGEPWRVRHKGQNYMVRVQRLPAADASGFEHALAEIRTERDGEQLAAKMQFECLAFSRFAQFVDRWDPGLMLARDEIRGRFHVNSDISVLLMRHEEPLLTGPVSVARTIRYEGEGNRRRVFTGDLETRARPIEFPRRVDPPPADALAVVQRIEADARIEFLPDGGYTLSGAAGEEPSTRAHSAELPLLIIATESAGIELSGTARGTVLVYSPRRVSIVGSLRYATDPREQPASRDFLGIISANIVEIARPNMTGEGDLEIFASIYAARRFVVRRASNAGIALLHIYGSLTAGAISASEPRFATRLEFDPRLEHRRLPYFPMSSRFERSGGASGWLVMGTVGDAALPHAAAAALQSFP